MKVADERLECGLGARRPPNPLAGGRTPAPQTPSAKVLCMGGVEPLRIGGGHPAGCGVALLLRFWSHPISLKTHFRSFVKFMRSVNFTKDLKWVFEDLIEDLILVMSASDNG